MRACIVTLYLPLVICIYREQTTYCSKITEPKISRFLSHTVFAKRFRQTFKSWPRPCHTSDKRRGRHKCERDGRRRDPCRRAEAPCSKKSDITVNDTTCDQRNGNLLWLSCAITLIINNGILQPYLSRDALITSVETTAENRRFAENISLVWSRDCPSERSEGDGDRRRQREDTAQ